jgi:hypothetical protein
MCLACLTYGVGVQNSPPLSIHFPDGVLRPKFNYSFYLTGATGVLTIFGAFVIVFMDIFYPRRIGAFFHHALTEEDNVFEVCNYIKCVGCAPLDEKICLYLVKS